MRSEEGRPDLLRRDGAARLMRAALAMQRAGAAQDALLADIGKRHRAQIKVNLIAELFPEIMRQAATLVAGATRGGARRAAGGADRLVDRKDNIGNARSGRAMREEIAAARAAHALDEVGAAQLRKQLLEIGERDFLTLGDLGEGDRLARAVLGEIDHGHHRVTPLRAQPHSLALLLSVPKPPGIDAPRACLSRSSSSAASRARSRATSPCSTLSWQAIGSGVSSQGVP